MCIRDSRDVVWITLSESARVNEELAYYGEELDSALVYLELFAPDTEKQEFESTPIRLRPGV